MAAFERAETSERLQYANKLPRRLPLVLIAALVEQGLFAGTNFFATILLVRWTAIEEVAAYSFGYASLLLGIMVYEAIVTEPIGIFAAAKYAERPELYGGAVLYGYVGASSLAVLALTVLAFVQPVPLLSQGAWGAAVAAPLLFLRPVTQQLCYARSRAFLFSLAGCAYAAEVPVAFYLLHVAGLLTPFSAMLALGAAMAAPNILLIASLLRPRLRPPLVIATLREVAVDHWLYGRWSTLGQIAQWVGSNSFYVVGPALLGLSAAAAIRPIFIMILPIQMAISSAVTTMVPRLARIRHFESEQRFHRKVGALAMGFLGLTSLYAIALIIAGPSAIHVLYRGAFDHLVSFPILLSLSLLPILSAMSTSIETVMRIEGLIMWVAATKALWTVFVTTFGIAACVWLGLPGVFIGSAICSALALLSMVGMRLVSRRRA
jgi:hypothetical protein